MRRPRFLEALAFACLLPGALGAGWRLAIDAYRGDGLELTWAGIGIYGLAYGIGWIRSRRDRRGTDETFSGKVRAVSVNDRDDGRDAHIVSDEGGRDLFKVWAKPGSYAVGEKLTMSQRVERR